MATEEVQVSKKVTRYTCDDCGNQGAQAMSEQELRTEIHWRSPDELPPIGEKILIVYHLGEPFTQEHDCVIVKLGKSGTIWYDNHDLDDRPCGGIKWAYVTRWVPCDELIRREPKP